MPATSFDPAFATALETANAVRTKKIPASELVRVAFERIDRYNPALNAIIWEDRSAALACARRADEAVAKNEAHGALHGVPLTIKESFAYRGSPNTWGLTDLRNTNSPRTAVAIERLEAAGAIVIGKTNVPVMLGDWQSYNPIYGTTNNPWDLSRTPGGSTGGGAAAVAAGMGAFTVGSDLAGSTRIPAHFCGVYGHKPSLELVSMDGFQPGPWDGAPGLLMDLAVVGALARSARDLALALGVLAGPNGDDAVAWNWRMPPPRQKRLEDFRIGYVMNDKAAPVASDVAAVYDDVLAALGRTGAKLERGWPPGLDVNAQMTTYVYLLASLMTVESDDASRENARKRYAKNPDDLFAAAAVEPHARWLHETQKRLAFRAIWQQYFASHDVFLLPASTTAAFPHDHSEPIDNRVIETPEGKRAYVRHISYWITSASLAGLPATVAPVGRTAADLPVGIQIVAPMWEDGTALEFAALLEDVAGGFNPPPAFRD